MLHSFRTVLGIHDRKPLTTAEIAVFLTLFAARSSYAWVGITSPSNDSTLSGLVTVKANISSDVTSELFIDGVPTGAATSGSVSFPWDTSTVTDGGHWLTVKGYKAGQTSADSSETIMVSTLNTKSADMSMHFPTRSSSSALPSGYWCAQVIGWENEPVSSNYTANHTVPSSTQLQSYAKNGYAHNVYDGRWAYARANGQYKGTTDMIMRWAACKWGIDEDVFRAQGFTESWKWLQSSHGDKRTQYSQCVQGSFTSLWGFQCTNCCYQSWSLWQTKVYYDWPTWPMMRTSTAFAADYRNAHQRVCMDGELKDYFAGRPEYNGHSYAADVAGGNPDTMLWGCIGEHYDGQWYDGNSSYGAVWYINQVKSVLAKKAWKTQWPSVNWAD